MAINMMKNVKDAIAHLNPQEIRDLAERPVELILIAANEVGYRRMENFFLPAELSQGRRLEASAFLRRATGSDAATDAGHQIRVYSDDVPAPRGAITFSLPKAEQAVNEILRQKPELALALARRIQPFREPVAQQIIKKVSKENALFSMATALPDIIPFLTLPWAIGEFASDTAILTANQIRMAFFLAASCDRPVGYREQKTEIGSILLGAFGWRAIARELLGKIPFGGGLIPKAAVAYAGTRVAGMSLERYYRIGYGFTQTERKAAYQDAFERGKTLAGNILNGLRNRQLAK